MLSWWELEATARYELSPHTCFTDDVDQSFQKMPCMPCACKGGQGALRSQKGDEFRSKYQQAMN